MLAEEQDSVARDSAALKAILAQEDSAQVWINAQIEPGVKFDSNKFYLDTEVKAIIQDPEYAAWIYQTPHTLVQFRDALSIKNLRLAFWISVRIYREQRPVILPILVAYDELIEVDKVLKAGFQTYSFLDPRITKIENGKPEVHRPDILDEDMQQTNLVIADVMDERQKRKAAQK